jgi:hypothetical protein
MKSVLLRSGLLRLALGAAICAAAPVGGAAADTYRVVNVRPGGQLTIRVGPSPRAPVLGRLDRDAVGIQALGDCVRGWCPVRDGLVLGWANGDFLERESPDSEQSAAGQESPAEPASTVLPDGTLEYRYADGRVRRRLPSGLEQILWPDGRVTSVATLQVQLADLPPLPAAFTDWGGRLGDDLAQVLVNILTPAEMDAYRQTEVGKGFYELLDWRLRSIRFLTAPQS